VAGEVWRLPTKFEVVIEDLALLLIGEVVDSLGDAL
jgi:hypothetical protein